MKKFDCDCCGACCKNIRRATFEHDLDRGDGVCKNFDDEKNLCKIYSERPILCNVDAYYEKFLSQTMTREDFHALNKKVCAKLRGGATVEN